jgi:class 3 adenylate cyclase
MTALRTTAIMKTDISGSTARFRTLPEADLHALLAEHRELLTRHAAAHDGRIVKPEGDGFWLVFPSVTAAALAAMEMQEGLRLAQANRGDDRLVMRIVIALGDVLHEEGALVGETVVLAARIEALTPPDEIYLSTAARLAVNQAEVRTVIVDAFTLKGFAEPVAVYRVEQTHRTRIIPDQFIVLTDLRGFMRFTETAPVTAVEEILDRLSDVINGISRELEGTVRFSMGDAFCVTFHGANAAMSAAERFDQRWRTFQDRERFVCPMVVGVHQGTLYAFRSYLYGQSLVVTGAVRNAATTVLAAGEGGVLVSGAVRSALADTPWAKRLSLIDLPTRSPSLAGVEIYRFTSA